VRRAHGFSLVELMVAITLALIVTAAVISVFVGSRTAYESTTGVAALTDSGRTAAHFIQEAGRIAGYMACTEANGALESSYNSPVQNQLNLPVGTLAYDFRTGIGGYEANGTAPGSTITLPASPTTDTALGNWSPTLDATFTALGATQVQNSDVLVFRSSWQATPAYLETYTPGGATQISVNDGTKLQASQIVAISDCTKAVVFQVGSSAPTQPGTVTLGGGPPGNAAGGNVTLPFAAGAMVQPLTTSVFYIGVGSDGDNSLYRLDLNGSNGYGTFTPEELVPDIENMQVLYGIDTNDTLVPSEYVTASAIDWADWAAGAQIAAPDIDPDQIVAIKVALLAASAPGTGTGPAPAAAQTFNLLGTTVTAPLDNRQRQVFEFTVTVREAVN